MLERPLTFRELLERLEERPPLVLLRKIVRIDVDKRFGFIRSPGRRDTFFHAHLC